MPSQTNTDIHEHKQKKRYTHKYIQWQKHTQTHQYTIHKYTHGLWSKAQSGSMIVQIKWSTTVNFHLNCTLVLNMWFRGTWNQKWLSRDKHRAYCMSCCRWDDSKINEWKLEVISAHSLYFKLHWTSIKTTKLPDTKCGSSRNCKTDYLWGCNKENFCSGYDFGKMNSTKLPKSKVMNLVWHITENLGK